MAKVELKHFCVFCQFPNRTSNFTFLTRQIQQTNTACLIIPVIIQILVLNPKAVTFDADSALLFR